MAPTISADSSSCQDQLPLQHKLRKPLVEKFRRERINSSIEQLKSLLGPEFLQQQPDSKLEKADVLEMTVCVLRRLQQLQHPPVSSAAVHQGHSRCVQETTRSLCGPQVDATSPRRPLTPFSQLLTSAEDHLRQAGCSALSPTVQTSKHSPAHSAPWRPW